MYKNKLLYPLVPLNLKKFDLFGFPVIDNVSYYDIGNNSNYYHCLRTLRSIYHPDKFGNIRFIIYHQTIHHFCGNGAKKCDNMDLSKGKFFCIQIPYSDFSSFFKDYYHKYDTYLDIIDPSIDDIAKYTIYSPESFYQMTQNSSFSYMIPLETRFVDCSSQIIASSAKNLTDFASKLKTTLQYVMFYCSNNSVYPNYRLFGYRNFYCPQIDCLKKLKPNEWNGTMNSLAKFTYSNSNQQLKIIWNSRYLEMIDF